MEMLQVWGLGEIFWLLKHYRPKETSQVHILLPYPHLAYQSTDTSFYSCFPFTYELWAKELSIKHQKGEWNLFNLLPFIFSELDNERPWWKGWSKYHCHLEMSIIEEIKSLCYVQFRLLRGERRIQSPFSPSSFGSQLKCHGHKEVSLRNPLEEGSSPLTVSLITVLQL